MLTKSVYIIILGTFERERQHTELSSIRRAQAYNGWVQVQQIQKESRKDRIWLHNQLQNLRPESEGRVYIVP